MLIAQNKCRLVIQMNLRGNSRGNLHESQGGQPGLSPLRSDGSQSSQVWRLDSMSDKCRKVMQLATKNGPLAGPCGWQDLGWLPPTGQGNHLKGVLYCWFYSDPKLGIIKIAFLPPAVPTAAGSLAYKLVVVTDSELLQPHSPNCGCDGNIAIL
jgi:hypothetical protein